MKINFTVLAILQFVTTMAFATEYYCNGQYKTNGSTTYYPNGHYVNNGSTRYYPNGQYVNNGSTRYYPNGQYMNNGSTSYYPNGQYANNGSTRYYPNGQYLNNGSTCYYENGQSMGTCPSSVPVRMTVKGYTMKWRLNANNSGDSVFTDLIEMETNTEKFITNFYMSADKGEIHEISATCADKDDSERVKNILNLYNSSSAQERAAVKKEICN